MDMPTIACDDLVASADSDCCRIPFAGITPG
jgi:hypothetical protein